MFEKYLQKILRQHLGQFIQQIDSKQLNVGVFSGKIDIKNIKLKKSLLQKYRLPILIRHSSIKGLSLKIPWKNLFGSPLVITIESVLVLCQFANENIKGEQRVQAMIQMINNTIKMVGQELVEKGKEKTQLKEKSGLIDRTVYKMLDNLYLSVKNIHIRFQEKDAEGSLKYGYSFGCSLQSIDVYAVGPNNQKVFIDRSKLNATQTLIRKKIEMKNLSVYCNYCQSDFITELTPIKQQKIIEQKLLKGIYTRERFNSDQNKNNYILIMNVLGFMDEEHKQTLVNYDLRLNFQKLIVKLDKEVLNCLITFIYKLNQLNKKYSKEIIKKQLTKQDDLLFRKYCNAYLSDFKAKDYWSTKDKQSINAILVNLHESIIIQKIKYIVINQMSVAELSKFFAVKGQDLDKGLLEVSKEIKDLEQSKVKIQIVIPQITLYLVNEFSQSILQLNVLNISLSYFEKIVGQNRVKFIQFYIFNVSAVNNSLYILSADQDVKNEKFFTCSVQIMPQITNISGKVTSFNFYYDFQTIFKITQLFHLREIDNKCRNMAVQKIQQLQAKVNAKVKSQSKINLKIVFGRPKVLIRQGKINWTISINQIQCLYAQQITLNLQSFKIVIYRQKEEYLFIQPFNIVTMIKFTQKSTSIDLYLTSIAINFQYFIYSSLNNLNKYLFINKKNQIINKCTKSCQIFLKQNRWKKCFITLLDNHLYGWENENQYPLFNIRIRHVQKVKRGKIDILQVSNKKKVYQIAFKDQKMLEEWLKDLQHIAERNIQDKSLQVIQVLEDSQNKLDLSLESLIIRLNHHKFNKQQNEFNQEIQAVTSFSFHKMSISINYQVQSNVKKSIINFKMEDLKFNQNNQEYLLKLYKEQALLNVQIISDPSLGLNTDQYINIGLKAIQFYFNPSSLLRLLGFFHDMQANSPISDINYEQTLQQQNPNKIIQNINVKMSDINIICQNKITTLPIIRLCAGEMAINVLIKYYQTIINANIKNISAYELTNYPYTIYNRSDTKQIIQKIIAGSNQHHNDIDVTVKLLVDGSTQIKDGIKSFANATINNLMINYTHQMVFRAIDYLNNQILGIVYYPDFFPQFYCEKQRQKEIVMRNFIKSPEELFRMKYIAKLGRQKLKLMLQKQKPLSFNIILHNSTLNVISDHSTQDCVSIHIEKTIISNKSQETIHQTNLGKIKAPHDHYLIEMKDVTLTLFEKAKEYRMSNKIGETDVDLKIKVQYFGGQLDYKFLFGDQLQISNIINADLQISMAKIHLNEKILTNILKILNKNIYQEDGVNFLMTYEVYQGCESLLNVAIHSQLLMIELRLIDEADCILTQIGGFSYKYDRNPSKVSKKITNKYTIFNFVNETKDLYKQILTSRKIFGRVSNRGTYYTQLFKQNLLINLSQDTSFQFQSIRDRKLKKIQTVMSAKQMMAIVDINFILYLQKIDMQKQDTSTVPPVYHNIDDELKEERDEESTQIKLDKIMVCAQVPMSQIIISVLATVYISIDIHRTQIVIPDLQAFISSSQHITCNELSQMKKRTLLKQTHLKMLKNTQVTQINLGKCFFKISINDVKSIHLIYTEVMDRYYDYLRDKKNRFGEQVESVQSLLIQKQHQQIIQPHIVIQKQKGTNKKSPLKIETSCDNIKSNGKFNKDVAIGEISIQLIPLVKQKQHSPGIRSISPKSSIQQTPNKETIYNLDTVQMMLVDDLNDFLTPLIYINLKLDLNQKQKAAIQFYADYFNLRNTLWEPLIQKNTLLIEFANNLTIKSLQPKEYININIASNFIQNLFKTINHKQLKSSRMFYTSHKVDKDQINSWIIINELGQDIRCESIDQDIKDKGVFVGKGEAQTLNFLSKEIVKEFKENQNEELFIKLIIDEKMIIKKLKINELGLKRLTIASGETGSIIIIKNLYIDLSKNIKYLTLSSEIIFQNKSDITIKLKQSKYNRFIYLLPFKSISLPYYCNLHSIIYSSHEEQQHYQNLFNLQHHSKLQINGKLFNISFSNRKLKKYFSFFPLYKITNYLPFVITINFKMKNSENLFCTLSLSSYEDQTSNFGFLYKPLQELQASIWIQNYQYTDFFTLKKLIQIRDYSNNILTIKSQVYKDSPSPMIHIALLVNYIIRNQTKQIFDAFVDNHWIRNITQGQYFISENNQMNLILNGEKSDPVFLTKKFSNITLKNKGNQMFKSESDYCLYKNRIEFDTSSQNRINFYISQLLPMYVVKNDNKYAILIKQNGTGVGQSQLIQGKQQQNIFWFLDSSKKRRNPLFKFTIFNSTYEWSCLINIQSIKKSNFVLRNKFNYTDIKYFIVNVKKIKETFQIYCKELTNNQIPYIIRNNTRKYNIFIDNLKVILKPGQQSYFCWQDPSINQKRIKTKIYKTNLSLQKQKIKTKNKQQFIDYDIKVESFQQENIASNDQNLDIQVINQLNRQIFVFSDDQKNDIKTLMMSSISIQFPIRIALINNSSSPASHIFDLTTQLALHYQTYSTNKMVANVTLKQIQLDNQTKPLTYFPVVLSTNLQVRIERSKNLQVQLMANNIRVSIQQDFITDLTAFLTYLQSLTFVNPTTNTNYILEQQAKEETFFISKLILPKITVQLEIQTKKFSIQTTINLEKPEITSYPWKNIPYPIKTIAFNILSHLSISPWAFISSFGRGLSMLITQQQTSKGFEGFFQQLIGGFSNSINGMVGMIVGHDIQKVDNFVDGLNKGFWALGTSLYQILPNFEGDYSPINIIKQVGTSVVNLAFKPVTGILRMTLRISQGIKKTTKFQFDFTSKKFKKRFPIVFFHREQTFYTYDLCKSQLINKIRRALLNQLKYFYLIETIQIEYKLRNEKSCLIIGAEELVLFNIKTQKMIWKLQIQKISNIEIHNLCTIQFIVNQNMQGSQHENKKKFEVDINSQQSVKKVMEIIERIKKFSSIQL